MLAIALRIMGMDATADSKQNHIGLANVADLFGYDLAYNDCGSPWTTVVNGTPELPVHVISSDHSRGSGLKCNETNADAPVKYLFSGWTVTTDGVVNQAWNPPPEPKDWPKPTASANADTASAPSATIDADGQLILRTNETTQASTSTNGDAVTHHVQYERVLLNATQFVKEHLANGFGIQLATDKSGGVLFRMGQPAAVPSALSRLQCTVDVVEPANCHYRVSLTTTYQLTKSLHRGLLRVAPQIVGVKGRLRARGDCENRQYRNKDENCGGAMGDDGRGVQDAFGQLNGKGFAEDMTDQANADSGRWYWGNIRALPLAQNQGVPNLDWALRYFTEAEFSKVAVDFSATAESVSGCTLHVEVLPGSGANCASMQDGASVLPTLTPPS